jgi:hypothetical protein
MQELACPRIPFARLLPEFICRQVAERALVTDDANSVDSCSASYNLLDNRCLDNLFLDNWCQDDLAMVLR